MGNAIHVIAPYWFEGAWVFDDPDVGLIREPFVSGVPEMINEIVRDIPDAREGFRLTFSASPFPGYQVRLIWVREEYGGNWYRIDDESEMEGWLCPALFEYFEQAPESIYIQVDERE